MQRNKMKCALCAAVVCLAVIPASSSADVFNMGTGLTSMELVTVGNRGNSGELSDPQAIGALLPIPSQVCGAVDYIYQIGKCEVTNAQYCELLNAVAASDPHGLYNPNMGVFPIDEGSGITRTGSDGSYAYQVMAGRANKPVKWVSFWDACRFANWLHNGQGAGDTETGAYTLTTQGIADNTVTRNPGWLFVVTNEDEWYKAAYHKNNGQTGDYWDYPTRSDTPPTAEAPPGTDMVNGSANYDGGWGDVEETDVGAYTWSGSPYGTFDQGGNAHEWNESIWNVNLNVDEYVGYFMFRGARGGEASSNPGERWAPGISDLHAMARAFATASEEMDDTGFRIVAAIPEPTTLGFLAISAVAVIGRRRRAG